MGKKENDKMASLLLNSLKITPQSGTPAEQQQQLLRQWGGVNRKTREEPEGKELRTAAAAASAPADGFPCCSTAAAACGHSSHSSAAAAAAAPKVQACCGSTTAFASSCSSSSVAAEECGSSSLAAAVHASSPPSPATASAPLRPAGASDSATAAAGSTAAAGGSAAVDVAAAAVRPLCVPAAASLGLPPPPVVPASLQQPPAEQHTGKLARLFSFLKPQTEAAKLRLAQKRYGYSLAELHAFPSMMELPAFPDEMLRQAARLRHTRRQREQQEQQQQEPETRLRNQQQKQDQGQGQQPDRHRLLQQQPGGEIANETPTRQEQQQAHKGQQQVESTAATTADGLHVADNYAEKRTTEKEKGERQKTKAGNLLLFLEEEMEQQLRKCQKRYEAIDRCVKQLLIHDEQSRHRYARLQECKLQWVSFNRCVSFRDKEILRGIMSWEKRHVQTLSSSDRAAYVEDMRAKLRYAEYVRRRTDDEQEALRKKRESEHLTTRLKNLEKLVVES